MESMFVEVRDLVKHYPVKKGIIASRGAGIVRAVDGVSFSIPANETFGLVGESGCGKSTIAKLLLLLEHATHGSMLVAGRDISKLSRSETVEFRRTVQAVLQDPYSSLNPRMRVADLISEPIRLHEKLSRKDLEVRVCDLLESVGLSQGHAGLYPHEFSGGQRQRIAIARALSVMPKLIVLDEPVSALDVSIRAQILNLLRDIQRKVGISYLLIAHDLAVVAHLSSTIGVMYLGKVVEILSGSALHNSPLHPYTQALIASILPPAPQKRGQRAVLEGEVPTALSPPSGCRFHPRCPRALPVCHEEEPDLLKFSDDHSVACHLYK